MRAVACVKWVDRRTMEWSAPPTFDGRYAGMSPADEAALEWALRLGGSWGLEVVAVTAGSSGADDALRLARSLGAGRVVRIALGDGEESATVGAALAGALEPDDVVFCGDHSLDRGTGSVPAFLAAGLDVPQALGLVAVTLPPTPAQPIDVVRRLDGGRREHLAVHVGRGAGAVLSVEGSTARLRRAGLAAMISARHAAVEVVTPAPAGQPRGPVPVSGPYRPRPRVRPAPAGERAIDRLRALTEAGGSSRASAAEVAVLTGDAAAHRILKALAEWGERVEEGSPSAADPGR